MQSRFGNLLGNSMVESIFAMLACEQIYYQLTKRFATLDFAPW